MSDSDDSKHDDTQRDRNAFKEGRDYYFNEDGLMVFTEYYHLKRGYCCQNNCKHCPFKIDNQTRPR